MVETGIAIANHFNQSIGGSIASKAIKFWGDLIKTTFKDNLMNYYGFTYAIGEACPPIFEANAIPI